MSHNDRELCPFCLHLAKYHTGGAGCSSGAGCSCRTTPEGIAEWARRNLTSAPPGKCAETTLDSGHRKTFASGSQRDAPEGKGRYDLISPLALRRIALVLERGAAKYEERNWELGQPLAQYMNSAIRHTFQYLGGYRDEDHLAQAMWNLHAAIHTEEQIAAGNLPAELGKLPSYLPSGRPVSIPDMRGRPKIERVSQTVTTFSNTSLTCSLPVIQPEMAGCAVFYENPGYPSGARVSRIQDVFPAIEVKAVCSVAGCSLNATWILGGVWRCSEHIGSRWCLVCYVSVGYGEGRGPACRSWDGMHTWK